MKILLVIPSYNEEKNIMKVYEGIREYNKKSKLKADYVFINDGSTDGSKEIFKKNKLNHIDLIHNLGIGGAVQTGYKYALKNNYDIAIQFDGDNQHDSAYIETIISPIINDGVDMVIGSRFVEISNGFQSSKLRQVGIKIISFFIKRFTHQKIYDTTSGFRAIDRKLIEEFAKYYPTEYPEPVSIVTAIKKGYNVKEVKVEMRERLEGRSSIRSWKNVYYMVNVILSIISAGLRRYK